MERDLDYVAGLERGGEVLRHLLSLARSDVSVWPERMPWSDPPPAEGGKEARVGLAVPGGPAR